MTAVVIALNLYVLLSFVCKSEPSGIVGVEEESAASCVFHILVLYVIPTAKSFACGFMGANRFYPD